MKAIALISLSFVIIMSELYYFVVKDTHFKIQEDIAATTSSEVNKLFIPIVIKGLQGYFVSPNGNDSNLGTFYLPWKTIEKAAQAVRPGDTVYIRDGTYHESVSFTTSGTESNPIVITAFPGENPVIDGSFTIPGYWGTLLFIRGDYNYISGLEVRNSAYMGVLVYGNYDLLDNLNVHHCKENGILITHGQHSIVQNSQVWRNALSNEFEKGDGWSSGLSAARNNVAYAIIRNNNVWENWGEGISSYEANEITIEGNKSHDNYTANVYISDSTNVICKGNFVYTNPNSYIFPFGSNVGIMMGDELYNPPSSNITINNNVAYGNQGNFWWWQGVEGGGMNNVLIANNTFVNGIGDPDRGRGNLIISRGDHQDVHFENNLVRQDGELPVIATIDQPGITYSHNLWSKPPYEYVLSPNDIIADPQLTETGDPSSVEWFIPASSSPAIDHALALPEVVDDYFGNPRGAFPDMGAIETIPE